MRTPFSPRSLGCFIAITVLTSTYLASAFHLSVLPHGILSSPARRSLPGPFVGAPEGAVGQPIPPSVPQSLADDKDVAPTSINQEIPNRLREVTYTAAANNELVALKSSAQVRLTDCFAFRPEATATMTEIAPSTSMASARRDAAQISTGISLAALLAVLLWLE
jgi:hypothetical protein